MLRPYNRMADYYQNNFLRFMHPPLDKSVGTPTQPINCRVLHTILSANGLTTWIAGRQG
jgi:hypothetical protein